MRLSVLVCTHNRSRAIIPCLDAITTSLSVAAPVDAEIVVIDNASTDDTSTVLHAWAAESRFPVNLQFEPCKGASYARNRALGAAKGALLVWTDDDCRLDSTYIRRALDLDASDEQPVLRGGSVKLGDPSDFPVCVTTRQKSRRWHVTKHPFGYLSLGGAFMGANMMMRRAVVDRVGLFDERFGPGSIIPAGEETDYIFRAYTAGLTVEFDPDLIVHHFHGRKTTSDARGIMRNYSIAAGAVHTKHLFLKPVTYLPVLWTAKNAIYEVLTGGRNGLLPEIPFSYRNSLACMAIGTSRYLSARGPR